MKWNAQTYDSNHQFVSVYGADLIQWLQPKAGENILDLGCGTGHLASQIESFGCNVIGFDASESMIRQAQENYKNIDFQVQDARNFSVKMPLDAIFSNATLHWIHEQDAVLDCVYQSLKPNGKLILEMGGKNNVRAIRQAIESVMAAEGLPFNANYWYFPSIGEYIQLLEKHDFEVSQAALFDRPTQLIGNHGMKNWIEQFAGFYFEGLSSSQKNDLIDKAVQELKAPYYKGGVWIADYKRLRIQAFKK